MKKFIPRALPPPLPLPFTSYRGGAKKRSCQYGATRGGKLFTRVGFLMVLGLSVAAIGGLNICLSFMATSSAAVASIGGDLDRDLDINLSSPTSETGKQYAPTKEEGGGGDTTARRSPFGRTKRGDEETNGGGDAAARNNSDDRNGEFERVHCGDLLEDVASGVLVDPNKGTVHKRHTLTDPPFWISLHNRVTDGVRCGIMEHGLYYERQITNHTRMVLADHVRRHRNPGDHEGGEKRAGLRRGTVIDVGMNIGWFSLWARALGHETVSFEPNPINQIRFCQSLALNGWSSSPPSDDSSTILYGYGVGDREGILPLIANGDNPGAATFAMNSDKTSTKITPIAVEGVRIVTLDSIAEERGWFKERTPIPLLKVDVEGFEPAVFRGANKLIGSGLVENVFMEYSCGLSKEAEMMDLAMRLYSANYTLNNIGTWNGSAIKGALEVVVGRNAMGDDDAAASDPLPMRLYRYCKEHKSGGQLNLWWRQSKLLQRHGGPS